MLPKTPLCRLAEFFGKSLQGAWLVDGQVACIQPSLPAHSTFALGQPITCTPPSLAQWEVSFSQASPRLPFFMGLRLRTHTWPPSQNHLGKFQRPAFSRHSILGDPAS